MKIRSIIIYCILVKFIFGCTNSNQTKKNLPEEDSKIFSVEKRLEELKKSGELLDSCQYLYHGNCIYRLCAPYGLQGVSDSILIQDQKSSRKLVKYIQIPELIVDKEGSYFKSNESFEIYSNVIFKSEYKDVTFSEFLEKDIAYSKENGKVVTEKGKLSTSDNILGIFMNLK